MSTNVCHGGTRAAVYTEGGDSHVATHLQVAVQKESDLMVLLAGTRLQRGLGGRPTEPATDTHKYYREAL